MQKFLTDYNIKFVLLIVMTIAILLLIGANIFKFVQKAPVCSGEYITGKVYNINGIDCKMEEVSSNTYFITTRCDKEYK